MGYSTDSTEALDRWVNHICSFLRELTRVVQHLLCELCPQTAFPSRRQVPIRKEGQEVKNWKEQNDRANKAWFSSRLATADQVERPQKCTRVNPRRLNPQQKQYSRKPAIQGQSNARILIVGAILIYLSL
jgi:hypothetical protein